MRLAVWLSRPLNKSSNRAISGLEYTALASAFMYVSAGMWIIALYDLQHVVFDHHSVRAPCSRQ